MSKGEESTIWLVCPKCRSRREVAKNQVGERILCRQCSTPLVATGTGPAGAPTAAKTPNDQLRAQDVDLAEEELVPEPPPERIEVYKAALENPPPPENPHDDWVLPPEGVALTWAFFSGVFTYAWWPNAIGKWIFLSVMLSIAGCVAGLLLAAFSVSGSLMIGLVLAGCFAFPAFVGVFALNYAAACMVDIVVNTAYNTDKASNWPDPDWRERFVVFIRMGCLVLLAIVPAAAIATLLSVMPLAAGSFNAIFLAGTFVLFPIILLSSMEADSLWPLSLPTWRSLISAWPGWAVFYAVSAIMALGLAIAVAASIAAFKALGPLIFCPIAAAALFSYARLLGRLAWFIRHREGDDARLNARYADRAANSGH